MQVLVAGVSLDRNHVSHPEVILVGRQRVNGLSKSELDLKTVTIQRDDLKGFHFDVRGHHSDRSAFRMLHDHETS